MFYNGNKIKEYSSGKPFAISTGRGIFPFLFLKRDTYFSEKQRVNTLWKERKNIPKKEIGISKSPIKVSMPLACNVRSQTEKGGLFIEISGETKPTSYFLF